jgi:hypothetical protein
MIIDFEKVKQLFPGKCFLLNKLIFIVNESTVERQICNIYKNSNIIITLIFIEISLQKILIDHFKNQVIQSILYISNFEYAHL